MSLRKVIVSKAVRTTATSAYSMEPAGEALFHQFGMDYDEFESGPGNFSAAIVEWPDGRVEVVPAWNIRFVEPLNGEAP